jgi:hypothetical protein
MKRILVVTVLLMLAVVGYRSPFVQKWLSQGSDFVISKTQSFGEEYSISKEDMFAQLGEALSDFSEQEKIYIGKISRSDGELRRFHSAYCLSGDYNPILFDTHLKKVCDGATQLLNRI